MKLSICMAALWMGMVPPVGEDEVTEEKKGYTASFVTIQRGERMTRGAVLQSSPERAETALVLATDDGITEELSWASIGDLAQRATLSVEDVSSSALVHGLSFEDEYTQGHCEELLRQQGVVAHDALVSGVRGATATSVRGRCMKIFSKSPSDRYFGFCKKSLRDSDETVRRYAIQALASMSPEEFVDLMDSHLAFEKSIKVRHMAVAQIGLTGDVAGVDVLLRELEGDETHRSIELQTFASLRRLTKMGFGRDEAKWRAWWHNNREQILEQAELDGR